MAAPGTFDSRCAHAAHATQPRNPPRLPRDSPTAPLRVAAPSLPDAHPNHPPLPRACPHSYEFSAPQWHDFTSHGDGERDGSDGWFATKQADPPRAGTQPLAPLPPADENAAPGHANQVRLDGTLQALAGWCAVGASCPAAWPLPVSLEKPPAALLSPRQRPRSAPRVPATTPWL